MTYGLTNNGFVRKDLQTVRQDIEAALYAAFGEANIKPHLEDSRSVWNKLVGSLVLPFEELWELAEAVYNSQYPTTAQGVSLARCAELVGVIPKPALSSLVQEVLEGAVGTTIPVNSKIATSNTGDQFQTADAATLSAAVAVCSNTELIGDVTNGKQFHIIINGTTYNYTATVPFDDADDVSAGLVALINAGAHPVTADDLGGGEVRVLGDDDADGLPTPFTVAVNANVRLVSVGNLVECESVEAGPIVGLAGTIVEIVNPLGGWIDAWNPLDAVLGNEEETASALRIRRAASLANPGAGTVEAIRAKLLAIDEVTACIVLENTSDVVDGEGLLPHSIEAIVENGDDEDIADVLWEHKAGGIYLNGTELVMNQDTQGIYQPIRFSRPTPVLMWVKVSYTKYSEETFPANGEDTIAATALAFGNALSLGNDVLPHRFKGPIFEAVEGIATMIIEVKEHGGAYQATPWAIAFREVARFDSARIEVIEV